MVVHKMLFQLARTLTIASRSRCIFPQTSKCFLSQNRCMFSSDSKLSSPDTAEAQELLTSAKSDATLLDAKSASSKKDSSSSSLSSSSEDSKSSDSRSSDSSSSDSSSSDSSSSDSSSSDSSSNDSSSSSDSESDDETKTKLAQGLSKREAAVQKLNALLASMSTSENQAEYTKPPITLSKPIKTLERKKEVQEKKQKLKEVEALGIDEEMFDAVKAVAGTLGGDAKRTESELLKKLREHATQIEDNKVGKVNMESIFLGMKIDRTRPDKDSRRIGQSEASELHRTGEERRMKRLEELKLSLSSAPKQPATKPKKINLFGSGSLNIFSKSVLPSEEQKDDLGLKIWEEYERREMEQLFTPPPANPFEEMVLWTQQGKLWTFPINNEYGLEEEAKYGFHDHVFLEHLLEDGFPKKGPIRHFMELVTVGLSKNPYLTVPEKHAHVDWFREYFKDKEKILKDIGAL